MQPPTPADSAASSTELPPTTFSDSGSCWRTVQLSARRSPAQGRRRTLTHQTVRGQRGTLGIITEITLRLIPAQPPASTVVASFDSVQEAADAVLAITSNMRPAMLEFMDHASINAVEDSVRMGLNRKAHALLLAQSDAPGAAGVLEIETIVQACENNGATEVFATDDQAEGDAFAAARRAVFPAVLAMGSLLLEDVGVPMRALPPQLVTGVEAIADDLDVLICTVAHAGDGNTHPLIVFDPPADPDMYERAQIAFGRVMDLAIALGGTITGEHGWSTQARLAAVTVG